jgi:hypothetical protein
MSGIKNRMGYLEYFQKTRQSAACGEGQVLKGHDFSRAVSGSK